MKWAEIKNLDKEGLREAFSSMGREINDLGFWVSRIENENQFNQFSEQFSDNLKTLHDLKIRVEQIREDNM